MMPLAALLLVLDDAAIRGILEQRIRKQAHAIAVGVVDGGRRRVVTAGGLEGDSVLEIGSVTKAFTGILLAEMNQRGEVALDDPVRKHLPEGVRVPARNGKEITLAHLSEHSSGLPPLPPNLTPPDPANPYAGYTVEKLYAALGAIQLGRDPGEKYEYSTLGAGLLGHVLALRAGQSYEALLRERVLAPLGMSSTAIVLAETLKARLAPGHDRDRQPAKNWDLPVLAGAGALRSTVHDLLRFVAAHLGLLPVEGPLGGALAMAAQSRRPAGNGNLSSGLGWHIHELAGTRIVWHNGGTGGYRSFVGFSAEKKLGVVVLCDTFHDIDDIGRHLLDERIPLTPPPVERRELMLEEKLLAAHVGDYEITPKFKLVVRLKEGRLHVQPTGQPEVPVYAETEKKFFFRVTDAQITFTPEGLILHQGGRNVPARRIPGARNP
jgi:CubicO group peptidase (beta-lactamase class C family)